MSDIVTPEQRRRNMQNIKSKNTKPELYLRKLLYHDGFRYRIYTKNIPGHPDIWLGKYNTAIFVHGCFWHRHKGCKFAYTPKTRTEFWNRKFEQNIERDIRLKKKLSETGIRTVIIWECTIKRMQKSEKEKRQILNRIYDFLWYSESILLEI